MEKLRDVLDTMNDEQAAAALKGFQDFAQLPLDKDYFCDYAEDFTETYAIPIYKITFGYLLVCYYRNDLIAVDVYYDGDRVGASRRAREATMEFLTGTDGEA